MSRPSFTQDRFVGETETCFRDLINKFGGLTVHELLAEFCNETHYARDKVTIEMVQRWQRGDYFPEGLQLLQLRWFLTFAGYDVTELQQIGGDKRTLGLAIALGAVDPAHAEGDDGLKYAPNGLMGIWDITLRGRGMLPDRQTALKKYLTRVRRADTREREAYWRSRISEVIDALGVPKAVETPPPALLRIDPALVATFTRQVAATISLAVLLGKMPGGREAALSATRGGADIQELRRALEGFIGGADTGTVPES
ncbi:MAG TPA: hypothetical protein VLF59_00065 [Candidatus Saccharimonadales bacterium]|nr:hypothetical protein [Candidatus Saccharimonadales bacterium]